MKNFLTVSAALALLATFSCNQFGLDKGSRGPSPVPEPAATNPAPAAAPAHDPTFKLDASTIMSWEDVNLTFDKPLPRAKGVRYFLTVVEEGTPDRDKGDYFPMSTGGTWARKSAPDKGGKYEVRLLGESPDKGLRVLCRRPLTVKAAYQAFLEGNTKAMTKEVTSAWDTGAPRSIVYYMKGEHFKELFREEAYYDNGQLQEQVNFEGHEYSGPYKQWWPSGQPRVTGTYKDGVMDGQYTEYKEDGSVSCQGKLASGLGRLECMDDYGNVDHEEMYTRGREHNLKMRSMSAH